MASILSLNYITMGVQTTIACTSPSPPGLDANYGLFTSTPDGLAYPNPAAERIDGGLALLEFMGASHSDGTCLHVCVQPFLPSMGLAGGVDRPRNGAVEVYG